MSTQIVSTLELSNLMTTFSPPPPPPLPDSDLVPYNTISQVCKIVPQLSFPLFSLLP